MRSSTKSDDSSFRSPYPRSKGRMLKGKSKWAGKKGKKGNSYKNIGV